MMRLSIAAAVLLGFLASVICEGAPAKSIVILAQGRSGSSFLSSWFGSHPSVTYFLEPCGLIYLKGVARDKTGTSCAATVKQLLACDFSAAEVTRDQQPFIPKQAVGFKGWGHQRGNEDVAQCNTREATVAKELRIGVAWAERQAEFSKVIVLLRDPRAVLNSRVTGWPERSKGINDWSVNPLGWDGRRGFPYKQSLKSLCLEHLKLRQRAGEEAPHKVLLVEYEELLVDAHALLKRVMEFSNIELLPEVVAHVQKSINGSCEHADEPFSLCRSKVPERDDKWKKELPESQLSEFVEVAECREVIEKYYPDTGQVTDEVKEDLDEL